MQPSRSSGQNKRLIGSSKPLCSFGILADVHYADVEDGYNFTRSKKRFYRRSLDLVQSAVKDWSSATVGHRIKFVLQLGDLIDGCNAAMGQSELAVDAVRSQLSKLDARIYQLWGNHELYNFSRVQLLASEWWNSSCGGAGVITTMPGETAFYHFAPVIGFRVVMLDVYENSMLGYDEDSQQFKNAQNMLRMYNPNNNPNSPLGMPDVQARFVQFNGGTSKAQIEWLDNVLSKAQKDSEIVLVFGHIPIYPSVTDNACLCWNYLDILHTLHRHSCVLAYFAGHSHDFAYSRDCVGMHHVVLPGIIETPLNFTSAHVTVLLFPDSVIIRPGPCSPMGDDAIVMEVDRRLNCSGAGVS